MAREWRVEGSGGGTTFLIVYREQSTFRWSPFMHVRADYMPEITTCLMKWSAEKAAEERA